MRELGARSSRALMLAQGGRGLNLVMIKLRIERPGAYHPKVIDHDEALSSPKIFGVARNTPSEP